MQSIRCEIGAQYMFFEEVGWEAHESPGVA